jgi:hypothetical protein
MIGEEEATIPEPNIQTIDDDERYIITNQNVDIGLTEGDNTYSIVWKNTEIPAKALGTHTLEYDIENEVVLSHVETLENYKKKQNSLTGYAFLMNVYLDIGHQCMLMMQNGYTVRSMTSKEIIVIDDRFVCFPDNMDVGMETFWIKDLLKIVIQILIPNSTLSEIASVIDKDEEDENKTSFDQMLTPIKGTPLYYSLKMAKEQNEFVYM